MRSHHPRRTVIGEGPRTIKMEVMLNRGEADALDMCVKNRRCLSRADYVRYIIEADHQQDLALIDDGIKTLFETIARAFGGAAAELVSQADAYRLHKEQGDW